MNPAGNLRYQVFVNDPPPQEGFLPDGEPKRFSPMASTLDDAEELLRTEDTAVGFFNANIERYPDHLGRMILWVSASALYGVRDHPGKNAALIILNSWF